MSRVKRMVTSAPASPLHDQLVLSTNEVNVLLSRFPSMRWTQSIGSDVPHSSGCSTFSKVLLRQGHLWRFAEVSSHLPENDCYRLGLVLHHTPFMFKSRRQKAMKSSLGLGLSELVYRLPGADTLPPLEPVASRRRGWGSRPELLDSGKDDECQVGDLSSSVPPCEHIWELHEVRQKRCSCSRKATEGQTIWSLQGRGTLVRSGSKLVGLDSWEQLELFCTKLP